MANLLHFEAMMPDFISWHVKDLPHCGPSPLPHAARPSGDDVDGADAGDVARAQAHADQMVFEGFLPA